MRYLVGMAGLAIALAGFSVQAHQAPLDSHGCHQNIAHGSYHCHTGPLANRQYQSRQHMLRARGEIERDERARRRVNIIKQGQPN